MLCLFHGRFQCVRRTIRFYLDQDYAGKSYLLLYNNSPAILSLGDIDLPENKHIILINRNISTETGKEYSDLGQIFNDAVAEVPSDSDIIAITDSDDFYLPNHLSQGVLGMQMARKLGKLAYKPYQSWFIYGKKVSLAANNMEPSIFIDTQFLKRHRFPPKMAGIHIDWLSQLIKEDKILIPKNGVPTFIYNWGEGHGNHKISGLGDREDNFKRHREAERDFGDGEPLMPISEEAAKQYYNIIKKDKYERI